MEQRWNDTDRGNQRTRRKTCPSATLSTINSTRTDLGANADPHGKKPAPTRLSYSMVVLTIPGPERAEITYIMMSFIIHIYLIVVY
jgi:hypothetical protein